MSDIEKIVFLGPLAVLLWLGVVAIVWASISELRKK